MRKLRIFEHISLDGVIQQSADENDLKCRSQQTITRIIGPLRRTDLGTTGARPDRAEGVIGT